MNRKEEIWADWKKAEKRWVELKLEGYTAHTPESIFFVLRSLPAQACEYLEIK